MHIKKLTLQNFRNYENAIFEFSDGINVLVGDNAQGKTNCAEAVFYLCTGYSPRVTREKQVIRQGAESAQITAIAKSEVLGNLSTSIEFLSSGKKITVNGAPAQKTAELIGNINAVMFDPQQLKLVQESPEDRRRFLDIALSQINRNYLTALSQYKRILTQRNNLLKNPDRELIFETLPVWDEQLATVALTIITQRNALIAKLKPFCEDAHSVITE
jgi:DNA replication and repair protein RecF